MPGTGLVPAQLGCLRQPLTTSWQTRRPARAAVPVPGERASTARHAVNQSPLRSRPTYARKGLHCSPSQLENPRYRVSFSHWGSGVFGFFLKRNVGGLSQPCLSKNPHILMLSIFRQQQTLCSIIGIIFSLDLNTPLSSSLFHLFCDNRVKFSSLIKKSTFFTYANKFH